MTNDDFISATEAAEMVDADPIEVIEQDPIVVERQIGRTRASVNLMSGVVVGGDWAAGDCQALRRLVHALVAVADEATARTDRAKRLTDDVTTGSRLMRDQLREALDKIDDLEFEQKEAHANYVHQVGILLAEITKLKADAGNVVTDTAIGERLKELTHRNAQLQNALDVEHRRADAAAAALRHMTDKYAAAKMDADGNDFRQKAVEATQAADQAFEEAKWKEGGRYLKLANTWINLLAVVPQSSQAPPT